MSDFTLTPPETRNQKRMREHNGDYTPPHVVLAFVRQIARLRRRVRRFLDPSAGAGIWGQVADGVWEGVESVGVEPRAEEMVHVRRNYSHALHMSFQEYMAQRVDLPLAVAEPFDVVASNIPFDPGWTCDPVPWFVTILEADLLDVGGVLALYGRTAWGQSKEMWPHLEKHPPTMQIRAGGRVSHREEGGGAGDEYSMFIWLKGHMDMMVGLRTQLGSPGWYTVQLPPLPGRRFKDLPGTYDLPPEFFQETP